MRSQAPRRASYGSRQRTLLRCWSTEPCTTSTPTRPPAARSPHSPAAAGGVAGLGQGCCSRLPRCIPFTPLVPLEGLSGSVLLRIPACPHRLGGCCPEVRLCLLCSAFPGGKGPEVLPSDSSGAMGLVGLAHTHTLEEPHDFFKPESCQHPLWQASHRNKSRVMEKSIIIPHFPPFSVSTRFHVCKSLFIRAHKVHPALKTELDTSYSEKKGGKGEIETTPRRWKSQNACLVPQATTPKQYGIGTSTSPRHGARGVQTLGTPNGNKST